MELILKGLRDPLVVKSGIILLPQRSSVWSRTYVSHLYLELQVTDTAVTHGHLFPNKDTHVIKNNRNQTLKES